MMTYHETLRKHLKTSIVTVEFVKKDGTHRRMTCTLKEDLLPPSEKKKSKKEQSEQSIIVYDLDKQDWRRINPDTITLWQAKPAAGRNFPL